MGTAQMTLPPIGWFRMDRNCPGSWYLPARLNSLSAKAEEGMESQFRSPTGRVPSGCAVWRLFLIIEGRRESEVLRYGRPDYQAAGSGDPGTRARAESRAAEGV